MISARPRRIRYDFGLSAAQEARADALHRDSLIVDLLSQNAGNSIFAAYPAELRKDLDARLNQAGHGLEGYMEAVFWPYEMSEQGKSDVLKDWYLESGLTCGTVGLEVHDGRDPQTCQWEALTLRFTQLPWTRLVTTSREIRDAKRDGVIAFYAHCQPTSPIPKDPRFLDSAYAKGLRSFMLTYNLMDTIGVGCTERVDAGLSSFGLEVVQHCNRMGMIVDVSHCGHLTTLDACRHSSKPVTANHTAARAVHVHARGKSDEALRAIADTGGLVGVVALPAFLTDNPRPTIEHMLDHIDHIANLVGWQHVAIGTDWPLQAPEDMLRTLLSPQNKTLGFREEDRLDVTRRLAGFDDCRDLPNITRGLVKRGYRDDQVRGILGENALRVFAEVID